MRGVFIDRDGVINEERQYVHKAEDFVLLPGVVEGLRMLQDANYRLVVVTNQSGIGRGYYSENDYSILTNYMVRLLATNGIKFSGIYHCPHRPSLTNDKFSHDCYCRKPNPGMLIDAARDLNLDLNQSVMVGDKISDIEAGRAAKVSNCVLVESGHEIKKKDRKLADICCANLAEAAEWIVKNSPNRIVR